VAAESMTLAVLAILVVLNAMHATALIARLALPTTLFSLRKRIVDAE
jgi:hypothetical protein